MECHCFMSKTLFCGVTRDTGTERSKVNVGMCLIYVGVNTHLSLHALIG